MTVPSKAVLQDSVYWFDVLPPGDVIYTGLQCPEAYTGSTSLLTDGGFETQTGGPAGDELAVWSTAGAWRWDSGGTPSGVDTKWSIYDNLAGSSAFDHALGDLSTANPRSGADHYRYSADNSTLSLRIARVTASELGIPCIGSVHPHPMTGRGTSGDVVTFDWAMAANTTEGTVSTRVTWYSTSATITTHNTTSVTPASSNYSTHSFVSTAPANAQYFEAYFLVAMGTGGIPGGWVDIDDVDVALTTA